MPLDQGSARQRNLTIDALRAAVPDAKILVGGAPVSPEFATSVGADGYGANATDAVERALELLGRPAGT